MTAQIPEIVIYEGAQLRLCSTPLESFFELNRQRPQFHISATACWRGYIGTWEILANRLYLIELHCQLSDGMEFSMEGIFPGHSTRVFAHWYSGALRIPRGELLQYVHGGFASIYEQDILLEIKRGIVVDRSERKNSPRV